MKKWWPTCLTLLVILYATLYPHPIGADEMALFPGYDKVLHAIMMGGLLGAYLFDLRRSGHMLTKKAILPAAFVLTVFAFIDELLQHIIAPNRTFDWWDILAGVVGIIIASFLAPPVVNSIFKTKKAE